MADKDIWASQLQNPNPQHSCSVKVFLIETQEKEGKR